jgi:hypothetical protein
MSKSRQLRTSCLPATLALSSGIVSDASATTLAEGLITAVETFDQAQIKGDVPKLRSLLADDHLLVNGDGSVEDRDDLLRDYAGGGLRINPLTIVHPLVRRRSVGPSWAGSSGWAACPRAGDLSAASGPQTCGREGMQPGWSR